MEEYRKYLDDLTSTYYNEMKPLVENIIKIGRCKHYNGTYINGECKYCRSFNENLDQYITKLDKLLTRFSETINHLPIKKMPINKLFNLLSTITNTEISNVNNLLSKYDYENYYDAFIEQTLKRIQVYDTTPTLSDLEINAFETYILKKEKEEKKEFFEPIYHFFIRNALLKQQNISYEGFKHLIKQFTEQLMSCYYPNPHCIIKKEINSNTENDNPILGTSFLNKTELKENALYELYHNGNANIFVTIFHELTHTYQFKYIFLNSKSELSNFQIKELKDYILASEKKNYGKENYDYLSHEHEANYKGIQFTIQYLNSLGLIWDKSNLLEEMEKLIRKMDEEKRWIDGKEYDLNELFDNFIQTRPYLLNKYPPLKQLYKIQDNFVYPSIENNFGNSFK